MKTSLLALVLLALAIPATAQANKTAMDKATMEKTQSILRELTQFDYKAKVDLPASDGLFVSDGKPVDAMYKAAMRIGKIAVNAGQTVKVSRVEVLDFAVLVSFSDGACSLIGTPFNELHTANASTTELIALAKVTVGAFFETVPVQLK